MSARHDVPYRTMNSMVASCPRCWRRKQRIQASQRCPAGDNRFFHMRGSLTSRVSGLYATHLQSKKSEEIQNNPQFWTNKSKLTSSPLAQNGPAMSGSTIETEDQRPP